MAPVRKRHGGRRHKKLKAIDPFYSGPRKLLVDKSVFFFFFFSLIRHVLSSEQKIGQCKSNSEERREDRHECLSSISTISRRETTRGRSVRREEEEQEEQE
jgi:hypothetical protein